MGSQKGETVIYLASLLALGVLAASAPLLAAPGDAAAATRVAGDLGGVVTAVALSKRTMRTTKENFFYDTVLIPVAAGVLMSPILAGTAMAFSSVSVVSNSLRVRGCRPRPIVGG